MAETRKILGQALLAATTVTDLYTVPGATSAVVSSIVVCNSGSAATTFRLSTAAAGAADATSQYLYYDVSINGNDTFVTTIGITLATTDKIRGRAGNGNLIFTVYGVEIS